MKPEPRSFPRKVMRCQAIVVVPGGNPVRCRTLDISLGGLSLMLSEQLRVGQECTIGFEAPLDGKMVRVMGQGKVVYSILAGADGFRVGMQFTNMDGANSKIVAQLMMG
ncbi:PilZ domain-containing protein [Noviherbaspirillum aerium]|uniref:PilZ domain-containing protein n=1 Tax=Noviherbaspirillum aerium TaxID=2588497 RepID=UPI00124C6CD8|nr:PilZ domain-containing protein [Noviherbaspirillum aerium]